MTFILRFETLGIYYGTKDPDDSDAVRKKGKTKGDIYFKIIQ